MTHSISIRLNKGNGPTGSRKVTQRQQEERSILDSNSSEVDWNKVSPELPMNEASMCYTSWSFSSAAAISASLDLSGGFSVPLQLIKSVWSRVSRAYITASTALLYAHLHVWNPIKEILM